MRNDQDNANQRLESVNEHKGRPGKNKCAARQARSLREIKIHAVGLFCVFFPLETLQHCGSGPQHPCSTWKSIIGRPGRQPSPLTRSDHSKQARLRRSEIVEVWRVGIYALVGVVRCRT